MATFNWSKNYMILKYTYISFYKCDFYLLKLSDDNLDFIFNVKLKK